MANSLAPQRYHGIRMTALELTGTLRVFHLFDIAEAIDLSRLHEVFGTRPSRREPAFRHPAPEYVRFERPPVMEPLEPTRTNDGLVASPRVRYFEYGVASVELQLNFAGSWEELVLFANHWISSSEMEGRAHTLLRERIPVVLPALRKPYEAWITEDYYIVQIDPIPRGQDICPAHELLRNRGAEIAQIVRGECKPLAQAEQQDVLQSSMSYYATDLLVAGWVAAFVYDTPAAALPALDLLEYANTQLLEFRYYDEVLTRLLASVYQRLERHRGFWSRWRLAREAEDLNTIRLDIREVSELTDNAIKFLSDMFYARVYRLAANRIGVTDYHNLVEQKLRTAGDLYDSMVNEFHQARAFVLEILVIIILLVEIVLVIEYKG
jgi:hypothetical protein